MEDLQRLLRLAEGTRLDILIKLAGLLGLRREEIVGLQWKHVDLAARKLEICSVRTSAGSQVITKEPKTSSSRRTLHIPDILAEALIRQKKHQEDCKAYLEDAYVDSGYVFTYEDGRPMRPNYASELFTSFIAQNHLPPLTLHGLRHSFASIASAKGIPMYDIICKSAIYSYQKATKFAFSQNKLQKQINQAENQLISCLIFGPVNSFEAAVQGYTQARPAVLCGTCGPPGPRCRGSAAAIGWQ